MKSFVLIVAVTCAYVSQQKPKTVLRLSFINTQHKTVKCKYACIQMYSCIHRRHVRSMNFEAESH